MSEKLIARLLFLVMLLSVFATAVACAESVGEQKAETSEAATETDTEELTDTEQRLLISDDLPEVGFDGKTFDILTRTSHVADFYCEEMDGDVINDAVYTANRNVKERFNIVIAPHDVSETDESTLTTTLNKSVRAGDDEYDLAIGHMIFMGTSVTNSLYYNLYDLQYIDFGKPWWIQSCQEQLTIDGKTFLALGDLTYNSLDYTYCFYFNKNKFQDYNYAYPYDAVNSGTWTFDYMLSLAAGIYSDLNGNNKEDEYDFYGFVTNRASADTTWTYAFGEYVTEFNSEGYPELVINNEKTVKIVEKLYDMFYNTAGVCSDNPLGIVWPEITINAFKNSNTLMATGEFFYATTYFRDIEDDYGFLPYPKWDESQDGYYTMLDGYAPLFGVPITIGDTDFVSIIIEAMSAEGYKHITPAYYDVALKTKFTRDEESASMINLILSGRVFDFGFLYDGWNGMAFYLQNMFYNSKTKDFASYYAKHEKAALKYYDKIITSYEKYGT